MSNSAGQPISPTLSPEVQEVVADWAKTLEAPGANPELLPTRGVGGDSRSRRKLERHLRARHAEEMGWFYGWKRFTATHEELGERLVDSEKAFPQLVAPLDILEIQGVNAGGITSTPLELAEAAVRFAPSALNRINLSVHQEDIQGMGETRDWSRALLSHASPGAAICTWRADLAAMLFSLGEYERSAHLYLENFQARSDDREALSCALAATLAGDLAAKRALESEMADRSPVAHSEILRFSRILEPLGVSKVVLRSAVQGSARSRIRDLIAEVEACLRGGAS